MSDDDRDRIDQPYRHLRIDEAPDAPSFADHKYELDEAVEATTFGFNAYHVQTDQELPWGRHYHPDHEELLVVVDGALDVEIGPEGETESVRVEPDEALFVPPGTFQKAIGAADETRVFAMGAPKGSDGAVIEEQCEACGAATGRRYEVVDGGSTYVLFCEGCGEEVGRMRSGV